MKRSVDFTECLKDSPVFRLQIEHNEQNITQLESELEKVVKLCNTMVDGGKSFINTSKSLVSGIDSLAKHFDDSVVCEALQKFSKTLLESQTYLSVLLDQAHKSISQGFHSFVKDEICKVKETKRIFDKTSDDLDHALVRNAQVLKNCKPMDAEETKNVLTATYSAFNHTCLDYAFQINMLQSKKRFELLDTLIAFMKSNYTYFHQGYDLFNDMEPAMLKLNLKLNEMKDEFAAGRKQMEERHVLVQQRGESVFVGVNYPTNPSAVALEGYLFKRSSNAFKSWNRRYFTLKNNQLLYQKRDKDEITVLIEDLRLCKVKTTDDLDRRFCFEIVSPTKSWYLEADTEGIMNSWIEAFTNSTVRAFGEHRHDPPAVEASNRESGNSKSAAKETIEKLGTTKGAFSQIKSITGNNKCADCGMPDPKWASINIGVVLCIECSGIHRSFGVHVSKVRSLTLDAWEPELIKVMTELGNEFINSVHEADLGTTIKPTPETSRQEKEIFIKSKYIDHSFASRKRILDHYEIQDTNIVKDLIKLKDRCDTHFQINWNQSKPKTTTSPNKSCKLNSATAETVAVVETKTDSSELDSSVKEDGKLSSVDGKSRHRVTGLTKMKDTLKEKMQAKRDGSPKSNKNRKPYPPKGDVSVKEEGKSDEFEVWPPPKPPRTFAVEEDGSPKKGSPKHEKPPRPPAPVFTGGDKSCGNDKGDVLSSEAEAIIKQIKLEPCKDAEAKKDVGVKEVLEIDEDAQFLPLAEEEVYDDDELVEEKGAEFDEEDESTEEASTEGKTKRLNTLEVSQNEVLEALNVIPPNMLLYKAAEWKCLPLLAAALVVGANVNWVNPEDDGRTPLLQAVEGGSVSCSEFLLQNGAKINIRDARGRGALHHAALLGQTGQSCQFLKKGANQHAVDENGQDPLTIALNQCHADIVTLLRLARLNEEMKDEESMSFSGDETFTDVFRDFSTIASTDPERLKRKYDPDRFSNV